MNAEQPPDISTLRGQAEEGSADASALDGKPTSRGHGGSSGRSSQPEGKPRSSTREEQSGSATQTGGAPSEQQSQSSRTPTLAKHADNSSELPSVVSERGSGQGGAYTYRQRTRRERWTLLETVWAESSVDRCRACRRWRADRTKGYEVCVGEYENPDGEGTERKAYVANIQTCRSSWGCPVCAAKIRQKRALQIAKAAAKHLEQGGGLEFIMLTMPHDRGDELDALLDGLKAGWDGISKGYARRKDWENYGIEHYVRSLDLTWSERAGWHPHYHVLLFTEEPLSLQDRRDLEQRFYRRWAEGVTSEGWRKPRREGVRFRSIESESEATSVGYYTAEGVLEQHRAVEEEEDRMEMGWEMTRHDLKSASGMTPWDILSHLRHYRRKVQKAEGYANDAGGWSELPNGELAKAQADEWRGKAQGFRSLWHEYEQATKGRRSIQPSRGLWDAFDVAEGDLEDEELAEEDAEGETVAEVDVTTMEWVRRIPGGFAALLEAAEDGTYIKRDPDGRIEMTGERARRAGAPAVGLTEYLAAVRKHYEAWRRG